MTAISDETSALEYIVTEIYNHCRIRLHDGKESLIKARLGKRMCATGYETITSYVDFLASKASPEEWTKVVDALTTNFTNFLREEDHFAFIVQKVLPDLLPAGQKRFNIWSAASSTGEEPYTIGFYLNEHYPLSSGWDWRIVASDLSTKALATAKQAIYAQERINIVPPEWQRRYFQLGQGEWEGHYRIKPIITERVTFRNINLIDVYEHEAPYEIIFCRNVMIYFDKPPQEKLIRRFWDALAPRGVLFTGHSESLTGVDHRFAFEEATIYRK